MEPLNLEYVARIIRHERPDAILPSLGGQTGLNLAVQLAKKGVLQECDVEILGTSFESIERAEDRELFKELCQGHGEPVLVCVLLQRSVIPLCCARPLPLAAPAAALRMMKKSAV